MMAHFPRVEAAKGGVIISDLVGCAIAEGVSTVALVAITEATWKDARSDNPWLPPTGQILKEMRDKTLYFQRNYERLNTIEFHV